MVISGFQQFNFLDIVIVILTFRICYVAVKVGLAAEFFKLLGVLFALYIASHYYTLLSDIIHQKFIHNEMPLKFMDFLIFIILANAGYLVFVILRSTLCRFMKMETAPNINTYGGLILGLVRAYFTVGLLVYALMISSVSYFSNSVKHSYLGSKAASISAQTYNWIWGNIFSKFAPQEKFNSVVSEAVYNLNKE